MNEYIWILNLSDWVCLLKDILGEVIKVDFIDELKQFAKRVERIKDTINTEEATKTSIIMPFFQLLGYDVFDPHEFLPEFTADVGIKKGEKVDYAIIKDGQPVILIEAKWYGDNLEKHDSQLFRYFGTTSAKFAILTNGITYRFFTDLEETNKMDSRPFLEFDIMNIKEAYVHELKKFHKNAFDVETIFDTAEELKYSNEIMKFMSQQMRIPSDDFVRYILGEVYSGVRTQNVIDKFRDIVKKSLNQFVNELMSDKITSALRASAATEDADDETEDTEAATLEDASPRIVTTEEELEAFFIVRHILGQTVDKERIFHRDTESYFGIILDNNRLKWICRLRLDGVKKCVIFPTKDKNQIRYEIDGVDDLYKYRSDIEAVVLRLLGQRWKLVSLLATGCLSGGSSATNEQQIHAILDCYERAMINRDVEDFANLFKYPLIMDEETISQ